MHLEIFMRIIEQDELNIDWDSMVDYVKNLGIEQRLEEKYKFDLSYGTFTAKIGPTLEVLGRDAKGKVILNLGCGSTGNSKDYELYKRERIFEPWVCRAFHLMGARVIGIDIGKLDGKEFEHYSLDLLVSGALDFLADKSVDITNARALFDSEQLESMKGYQKICRVLLPQLERIVKSEGVFLYTKSNGIKV